MPIRVSSSRRVTIHDRWKQTDNRFAFKLDARYDVGGILDYVQAGAKWLRSRRRYDYTLIFDGDLSGTPLDGLNMAESGLIDKSVESILRGEYYYGAVFDRQAVEAAIRAAEAAQGTTVDTNDLLADDKRGRETVWAGYMLGKFGSERFSVIAGARVEHLSTHNEFWSEEGDDSGFGTTDRSYTQVLPSVTATFRPSDRMVVRGALWTGYSPPEYGYLSAGQSITERDRGDQPRQSRPQACEIL